MRIALYLQATGLAYTSALRYPFAVPMKVLITAPSLDESENVSGIASLVRGIARYGSADYVHFAAGRKDGSGFDLDWITTQVKLPFSFRNTISREKPDILHLNTSFEPRSIIRDLVLAKASGTTRVPIVLHIHGGRFVLQDFSDPITKIFSESLLKTASRIIVQSDEEARSLLKRTAALPIAVLPNAVNTAEIPFGDRPKGERTIVFFGRLHESKGLAEIVAACRMLKDQGFKFKFECYGRGPAETSFVSEMTEVLGTAFRYRGIAKGPEKWNVLGSADIFFLPSKFEGLPLALLEAMAAGCVPVVSPVGMITDVVEDGHNGFIIDPGDMTQMVGKLKMLLSEPERSWTEYRKNARQTIVEKFDIKGYTSKLERIYAETLSKR